MVDRRNPSNAIIEWTTTLYGTLVLGVFLTGADMALGRNGLFPGAPTVGAAVTLAPPFLISLIAGNFSFAKRRLLWQMLRENLIVILIFMMIAIVSLALSLLPGAYWQSRGKWIFLNSYGFLLFVLSMLWPMLQSVRKHFRFFLTIAILAWAGSIVTDLFIPGFFSTETNRAAGFPGNSNFSALVGLMLCSARLRFTEVSRKSDVIILALVGLGVFCTLSRSGLVNYCVLLLFFAYVSVRDSGLSIKQLVRFMVGSFFVVALLAVFVPFLVENTTMFTEGNNRFSSFASGKQVDDGSADSRIQAALEAIEHIEEYPIIGNGTGFARRLSELPHNIYLQQWVNNGILGLFFYLSLVLVSLRLFVKRRYRAGQAFVMVILIGGFFSHNILDQRTFIILLSMQLTISYLQKATQQNARTR